MAWTGGAVRSKARKSVQRLDLFPITFLLSISFFGTARGTPTFPPYASLSPHELERSRGESVLPTQLENYQSKHDSLVQFFFRREKSTTAT